MERNHGDWAHSEAAKRALPPTLESGVTKANFAAYRQKKLAQFAEHIYGITPPAPQQVFARECSSQQDALAGKATHLTLKLAFDTPNGEFAFPLHVILPHVAEEKPLPVVVYLSFTPYPIGEYCPVEEVIDHGYGLATFCYADVTSDDNDLSNGLAGMLPRRNDGTDCGKLGLWAYAASRVVDYLLTLTQVDPAKLIVLGHSRLGKAALWAGAQDERFAMVAVNDSGCSGAAISRGKKGETIAAITKTFPYWFCENYRRYADNEGAQPYEMQQLLALCAPRPLYIASASEDAWADPISEQLSAALAGEAYALFGKQGLLGCDAPAKPGEVFAQGSIAYHLRKGTHFLSRWDWLNYLSFADRML